MGVSSSSMALLYHSLLRKDNLSCGSMLPRRAECLFVGEVGEFPSSPFSIHVSSSSGSLRVTVTLGACFSHTHLDPQFQPKIGSEEKVFIQSPPHFERCHLQVGLFPTAVHVMLNAHLNKILSVMQTACETVTSCYTDVSHTHGVSLGPMVRER